MIIINGLPYTRRCPIGDKIKLKKKPYKKIVQQQQRIVCASSHPHVRIAIAIKINILKSTEAAA